LVALSPDNLPRLEGITIDFWVMGFTVLLSLLTSLIFGLAPALKASKPDIIETLKQSGPSLANGGNRWLLRNLLVVTEVALAFVLLVGAGLLIRSFLQLQRVDLGFDPNNVLTMQISLPIPDFADNPKVPAFFSQVVERFEALPSVESVAGITQLPLSGDDRRTTFTIENRPAPAKGEEPRAVYRSITPKYFRTMRIPILRGREFTERDLRDSPGVVIINESMARQYWPDEDPVGKRISPTVKLGRNEPATREIVGVVGNVRYTSVDSEPFPELYIPHTQQSWYFMALAVRTSSDPMAMIGSVRREVMAVDADQPVYQIQTMEDLVSKSIAQPRFYSTTLGIFATLALILAGVGVYAVMSYSVTQRTHEIGVRMAVGAERRDVIKLILREGMLLTVIGMSLGLAGALALTRIVASLLFDVSPNDLITFTLIALLLIHIALLACYIPARRATKIDPMLALRHE
jgi:putative ABC transport system permease protein